MEGRYRDPTCTEGHRREEGAAPKTQAKRFTEGTVAQQSSPGTGQTDDNQTKPNQTTQLDSLEKLYRHPLRCHTSK